MQNESQSVNTDGGQDQWALIRDIAVLQVKLIVDGLRDLILVPISLVAGIVSLAKSNTGYDSEFYDLLRLGKKSERWINLFGAADELPEPAHDYVNFPDEDIDSLVSRVESFVVDEYRKGGVTKQAKERLDKAIESLHKLTPRKSRGKSDDAGKI
jgi:hypothetical protein